MRYVFLLVLIALGACNNKTNYSDRDWVFHDCVTNGHQSPKECTDAAYRLHPEK